DTNVTIIPRLRLGYDNSQAISINLNQRQTYQYTRYLFDITGSMVLSDKPISVLSGSDCTRIPWSIANCGQLVEQVPPLEAWGNQFVTGSIGGRPNGNQFRLISSEDDNRASQGARFTVLSKGQFWGVNPDSQDESYLFIECEKPCLLVQYNRAFNVDNPRIGTSPFMMIVPPLRQYTSGQHTFPTFKRDTFNRDYSNFLTVVSSYSGLMLNGEYITGWKNIPSTNYAAAIVDGLRYDGSLKITHWSKNATFAAFSYGHWLNAHGFPTGMGTRALQGAGNTTDPEPEFYTKNDYKVYYIGSKWNLRNSTENYVTFDVRTCRGAMIYLSPNMNDRDYRNLYHLEISGGDNRFSFIARGQNGPRLVQVYTPTVVSCDEFASFWIRWENFGSGSDFRVRLSLGMGTCIGVRELMAYTDSTDPLDLKYIGIGSYTISDGHWFLHPDQDCSAVTDPPTLNFTTTVDPSAPSPTSPLPRYGDFQERCHCRFTVEPNITAGEKEPGETLFEIDDILYNLTGQNGGECFGCAHVMDRCRIDCTEKALSYWNPGGFSNLIDVEGGVGTRQRTVGQLLCEAYLRTLPPPGVRVVVYYDPGRCGQEFHTLVSAESLCCKEIDVPEIGFVVVWDRHCDGDVEWPGGDGASNV
ncbi:unnamed protein product, partial [Owenia fusiformis]